MSQVEEKPYFVRKESSWFRPQTYSGGDPEAFLRQFKRIARANGWKETHQLGVLPALFVGSYELIADELEKKKPVTVDDACKQIIEKLYPKEKRRERLHTFNELRMKESDEPRAFVNKLQELVSAALPDIDIEARESLVMEIIPKAVPEKWQLRLLDMDTFR